MRGAVLIAAAAGVAALALAPSARAAEAEPVAVDWAGPPGCGDAATFLAEVTSRTARARASAPGEEARVFHVRIERSAGAFTGSLVIAEHGEASSPRELGGASCSEVTSALALVAALAVDPAARAEPTAPSPPSVERSPSPSTWTVGAGGEVATVADAVAALRVFGDLELGPRAPSFRLAASRSLSVDRSASVGTASLAWTMGSVAGCPLGIGLGGSVALRPCAEVGLGILDASGSGVTAAESKTRPWVAAAGLVRLDATLGALLLEAEGGATFPLVRETFRFEPNVDVYEAPVIAGVFRIALGLRFP